MRRPRQRALGRRIHPRQHAQAAHRAGRPLTGVSPRRPAPDRPAHGLGPHLNAVSDQGLQPPDRRTPVSATVPAPVRQSFCDPKGRSGGQDGMRQTGPQTRSHRRRARLPLARCRAKYRPHRRAGEPARRFQCRGLGCATSLRPRTGRAAWPRPAETMRYIPVPRGQGPRFEPIRSVSGCRGAAPMTIGRPAPHPTPRAWLSRPRQTGSAPAAP